MAMRFIFKSLAGLLLLASNFAASPAVRAQPWPLAPRHANLEARYYHDTIWRLDLRGPRPEREFIYLRSDGRFSHHPRLPGLWIYGAGNQWWLQDRHLVLSWRHGRALARFDIKAGTARYPGRKRWRERAEILPCRLIRMGDQFPPQVAPLAASASQGQGRLVGTLWKAMIQKGNPLVEYLRMLPGGRLAYSFSSPQELLNQPGNTWQVKGGYLIVLWSNGFAEERYKLAPGERLYGFKRSRAIPYDSPRACTLLLLSGAP